MSYKAWILCQSKDANKSPFTACQFLKHKWHGNIDRKLKAIQNGYDLGMMTSLNGNIFRVIGPLWGEFTGHWWIPLTKASVAELWCFFLSAPEQTV